MPKEPIDDDGVTDRQAGMKQIPDLSDNGVSPQPVQARTIALVVAVAFFMQMLDGTIIATSLPQMGASFSVGAIDMSTGITAYMLAMAAFIPISGWLGDKYGARRIFLLSIAIFTLASVLCGFSQSLWEFVAARAVQGVGGALMTPVGRVIVLKNARKSELIGAIALITWPALTAPVLGPVLGGIITTYASWHWNFLVNIPFGIAGFILVLRFVPDQRDEDPGVLDLVGLILSAAGLVALLSALEGLAQGAIELDQSSHRSERFGPAGAGRRTFPESGQPSYRSFIIEGSHVFRNHSDGRNGVTHRD